jgi:hypothetical protein
MFSIKVGAQWTISTGKHIFERVFQAEKMAEDDGGQERGGNDRIWPLGRPDKAMDIPAI